MDKWFVYFNYNPHKGFIFLGCISNDQYAQDHAKAFCMCVILGFSLTRHCRP